jgi:hypothetical protein
VLSDELQALPPLEAAALLRRSLRCLTTRGRASRGTPLHPRPRPSS